MNKSVLKVVLGTVKDYFADMSCDEIDIPNTPENVEFVIAMMGDDGEWWRGVYESRLKDKKTLTISASSAISYTLDELVKG